MAFTVTTEMFFVEGTNKEASMTSSIKTLLTNRSDISEKCFRK